MTEEAVATKATIIFEDRKGGGVDMRVEFSPPFLQGDTLTYAQRMAIDHFNFVAEDLAEQKRMAEEADGVRIITPN